MSLLAASIPSVWLISQTIRGWSWSTRLGFDHDRRDALGEKHDRLTIARFCRDENVWHGFSPLSYGTG
jgi:hypothetical protein